MYIAEIQKILPARYAAGYIVDAMYPSGLYGSHVNQFAKRLAKKFGVAYRPVVIDFDRYPQIALRNDADHPKEWGKQIIDGLTTTIAKDEIGLFSLAYNLSYHSDILPNLASQIIMEAGLNHLDVNDEIAYYGCAASLYSLERAVAYCKEYERPAIVFTFDQCSKGSLQLAAKDEDFKKMLITNLLFTDGGAGMVIIPETLRHRYTRPLIKLKDVETKYHAGNLIKMKNGKIGMSPEIKNVMPQLVADRLVKPFMKKNKLEVQDVQEWSVHQGGSEILEQFCDHEVLGLTQEQIDRSLRKFYEYGNTSAASCLLVLESFFNDPTSIKSPDVHGIILGFGAGYYLGIALYTWDAAAV